MLFLPRAASLRIRLQNTCFQSERLAEGPEPEDLCRKRMADACPSQWRLGHTSWFFAIFLLLPLLNSHEPTDS